MVYIHRGGEAQLRESSALRGVCYIIGKATDTMGEENRLVNRGKGKRKRNRRKRKMEGGNRNIWVHTTIKERTSVDHWRGPRNNGMRRVEDLKQEKPRRWRVGVRRGSFQRKKGNLLLAFRPRFEDA